MNDIHHIFQDMIRYDPNDNEIYFKSQTNYDQWHLLLAVQVMTFITVMICVPDQQPGKVC
jgi:hypothetical protein